jgi:putative spermidine/putrescine transport system permease protein
MQNQMTNRTRSDAHQALVQPRRISWDAYLLISPALLLFFCFFILPLGVMAVLSLLSGNPVNDPDVSFTLKNYVKLTEDIFYFEVLWITLRIGLYTAVFCLLIGYPLAFQMARTKSKTIRTMMLMAVLSPMLVGIVVRTYAWMTILSDQGVINATLKKWGWLTQPLPLMYNEFGICLALVHIHTPFMVLTLIGVIGRIDLSLEEAARNLGAGKVRTFFEVTLPLSMPGIMGGSLLVFALAISAYVTPILMGGFSVITLPILIYQQISGVFNFGFGAALGLILLVVSLVIVVLYHRAMSRLNRGVGV